jgi:hypothetical protein
MTPSTSARERTIGSPPNNNTTTTLIHNDKTKKRPLPLSSSSAIKKRRGLVTRTHSPKSQVRLFFRSKFGDMAGRDGRQLAHFIFWENHLIELFSFYLFCIVFTSFYTVHSCQLQYSFTCIWLGCSKSVTYCQGCHRSIETIMSW